MHAPADLSHDAMLRSALDLAELAGVRIALAHEVLTGGRCSCGKSDCGSPGKHPRGDAWQANASSDANEIRAAFLKWPGSNIGIATGRASGVVVLDVDGDIGEQTLTLFPQLPVAPEVRTARGRHIYFAAPDIALRNRAGSRGRGLGPGLDLRAEGGFIVVPPSVHASGQSYAWSDARVLGVVVAPATPEWIIERAADRPPVAKVEPSLLSASGNATRNDRWARAALEREVALVASATVGSRNVQLNESGFNLGMIIASGLLRESEVHAALLSAALRCEMPESEALKTIRSSVKAGTERDVRSGPTRELSRTNGRSSGATVTELRVDAQSRESWAGAKQHDTASLFATLPAQRWCVPGLQIGPGRPTLIAGYGASAKTISVQALALALAAGRPIWGRFECSPMTVLHVDYEQGYLATAKRYQRLALGCDVDPADLDNRLHYVEMPRVYLDTREGELEYLRACEGVDLVIVDALRGASPNSDENDSAFRRGLDALTFCSQRTGASQLVLHHASKPKKDNTDARTVARGSSAIFDACGCVLNFTAQPGSSARLVTQVKTPAEAEGSTLEAFELLVEDVAIGGQPTAGARVSWRKVVPLDVGAAADAKFERDAALMVKAVRRFPEGQSTNALVARCGLARNRAIDVLRALADEGRLELVKGPNRAKLYRVSLGGES
jgi:hypothetical protein